MREEEINAVFFIRHLCHILGKAVVAFFLREDSFHLFGNQSSLRAIMRIT